MELLDTFERFIHDRSRLYFSEHKRPVLKSRLEERATRLQLPNLAAYWDFLRNEPEEESRLLETLTVNETFFFRNPRQFRHLSEKIVPELEAEKGREVASSWGKSGEITARSIMKLRVLCAGCSTGEEPYSVAMTLLESLRYPRAWDIRIVAGDLSEWCVKSARAGFYENAKLKGIPPEYLERHFVRTPEGAFVNAELKRLVAFFQLNLKDVMEGGGVPGTPPFFNGFDIIFCRNVMIYFSSPAQQNLVNALFRLLAPGGYLFTGDAEPLHLFDHGFSAVHDAGCLVYRKMEKNGNAGGI